MRSSDKEKKLQVEEINEIKSRFLNKHQETLKKLKQAALAQKNTFEYLMEAAKYSSLGEISQSFFEVGGAHRQSM